MGENFYKLSKVYFKNSVNLITKQCDLKMDKETFNELLDFLIELTEEE